MNEEVSRCNVIDVPAPGTMPRIDPRCLLEYGHDGPHEFAEGRFPKQEDVG
ncbi:MAG TPA: hypothetical protein VJQ59_16880 [Candidatus Sulfotelmatobacter sp.]|nr:hypothetical protein [Candidatus Sulfotelmatobacter sp.]